jgi:hypothetical protein
MEKQKAKTRAFKMVELISRGLDARKKSSSKRVDSCFCLTSPFIEPFLWKNALIGRVIGRARRIEAEKVPDTFFPSA